MYIICVYTYRYIHIQTYMYSPFCCSVLFGGGNIERFVDSLHLKLRGHLFKMYLLSFFLFSFFLIFVSSSQLLPPSYIT